MFPTRIASIGIGDKLTSQSTTLLQVVNALARIALAQLLADQAGHHAAHPLLADNCIAGVVHGNVVFEVDTLVGRGHGGLLGEEGGGLGSWHCGSFLVDRRGRGGRIGVQLSYFPAGPGRVESGRSEDCAGLRLSNPM